tara:strand:+ start:2191 stop:2850 length:660 start_codon:yes stop_codon:yes gene_type:complete
MKNLKSPFKELTAINVNEKVEKKGKYKYLSWAYAWAIIKDKYPNANRKVYESKTTELNYFTDGKTGYVKVGVCLEGYDNTEEKNALGLEHVDYLPIKGNNNQSIPLGNITSFSVNTSIQRSTAKAIGMHGLGLSLWAGEDLKDIGDDTDSVADEGLDLGIPNTKKKKKEVTPPTGDPTVDIPVIQNLVKAKKTWDQIEEWLRLIYDDLTIEEYKNKYNE